MPLKEYPRPALGAIRGYLEFLSAWRKKADAKWEAKLSAVLAESTPN